MHAHLALLAEDTPDHKFRKATLLIPSPFIVSVTENSGTWVMLKRWRLILLKDVMPVYASKPVDEKTRQMGRVLLQAMGVEIGKFEEK